MNPRQLVIAVGDLFPFSSENGGCPSENGGYPSENGGCTLLGITRSHSSSCAIT